MEGEGGRVSDIQLEELKKLFVWRPTGETGGLELRYGQLQWGRGRRRVNK